MHFNVMLDTQLGKRKGILLMEHMGTAVSGTLQALGKESPFEGTVDEYGCYHLKGNLITLMKTYPFEATGQIIDGFLRLMFRSASGVYSISGARVDSINK